MSTILTVPNEILDQIAVYLLPRATANLLLTCRSLSTRLAPNMSRHARSPKNGLHALHWAADHRYLPLLQSLLPLFSVDLPDACGNTALYYTCRGRAKPEASAEEIVRFLITHGANPNGGKHVHASRPLLVAFHSGYARVAAMLLEAGADPNCESRDGDPLMFTPLMCGDQAFLELLLDHGADITRTDTDGDYPVMVAIQHGHLEILKMLIGRGADLRCVSDHGATPLLQAIAGDRVDIAVYLAGLPGVDLTRHCVLGIVPLHFSARMGFDTVVRVLIDQGCLVDSLDPRGHTALQFALAGGHSTVVQILLEKGANSEIGAEWSDED